MLIQQARGRGRIDLVVSSRSMSGSGGKQSHSRSSGSDVSRDRTHVPDGVVLREKKSEFSLAGRRWEGHLEICDCLGHYFFINTLERSLHDEVRGQAKVEVHT